MRFVAAALVLCTHATFYYHERIDANISVWHFGEVGVPIFFVISGIVMVLSTHESTADVQGAKAFILRRIIRVVPLYWIATAAKVAVTLFAPDVVNHNHFRVDYAIKSFLFIPYFNEQGAVVPLHGVGWTLLHEMFFYCVFTAVLFCGKRPAAIASGLIITLWLLGTQTSFDNPFWAVASSGANLNFVTGMLAGSALVLPLERRRLRLAVGWCMAGAAAVLFVVIERTSIFQSLPFVVAFGSTAVLFSALRLPNLASGVTRLGDSSYSLYLFHPFIAPAILLAIARWAPPVSAPIHITVAILITIFSAHLLHLWVEVPVVRMARSALLAQRSGRNLRSKVS